MDDSDEKARRNVVMVSAAILFAAWVRLVPETLMGRLFGEPAGHKIEPSRIWSSVLAVLLYVGLRYWFAPETSNALSESLVEWRKSQTRMTDALLKRHAKRFARKGTDSKLVEGGLAALVSSRMDFEHERDIGSSEGGTIAISFEGVDYASGGWPQSAAFTISRVFNDGRTVVDSGYRRNFSLPDGLKLWLSVKSAVWLIIYSRACTHVLVPISLWVLAFALAGTRLAQAI